MIHIICDRQLTYYVKVIEDKVKEFMTIVYKVWISHKVDFLWKYSIVSVLKAAGLPVSRRSKTDNTCP